MKENIFVISTIFLGIVVVALLFTIATLQSDLRNVTKLIKLAKPIDTTTIQVNMNK